MVSLAIALIGGARWSAVASMSFALIGVAKGVHGYVFGARRAKLEARLKA